MNSFKIIVGTIFLLLLSILPYQKAHSKPEIDYKNYNYDELENKCRQEIDKNDSTEFYKISRYFSPITLKKGKVDIYPLDFSKLKNMYWLKEPSELKSIPFNDFQSVIDKYISELKPNIDQNSEMLEMLNILKPLLYLANNPGKLASYPCLSLYFEKCYISESVEDIKCISEEGHKVQANLKLMRNYKLSGGSSTMNDYFKFNIFKSLQEYFGLFGQLDRWAFIPYSFMSPEEEQFFIKQKSSVTESGKNLYKTLSKRGALPKGGVFFPKILSYYTDALEKCLSSFEKQNAPLFIESEFYKNECWVGKYVHPIDVIKEIFGLMTSNKLPLQDIQKLNGSFYFHGTTSRFFSYAFFKKDKLKLDDLLIKSRMKLVGAKILLGEHITTETNVNAGWVSASTLTGLHKALSYSGVYRLPDNSFFYGLTYPDRAHLAGIGFKTTKKSYDEVITERKISEKSQIEGFSDPDQRFYFEENFPVAFGFAIPKSYLVSKKAVSYLNEVMWFGGIPVKSIRLLIVPKKYKIKVKDFFRSSGEFDQIEIITFEDLWKPVSQGYFSEKILKYERENKPQRVQEFKENEILHRKFSGV